MEAPESDVLKLAKTQLQINNIVITRDSQRWLLHLAGKIPLQAYYNKKWGWTDRIFDSISWKTQHSALQKFDTHDQTRILKFVHGWLPTQHRLYKEGTTSTPKCKLCQELYEDNLHLFSCKHPHKGQIQEEITTYLAKSLHDHGNSELTNILEIALGECTTSSKWQPDLRFASLEWHNGIEAQNNIGWRHILFGRISRDMIQTMEEHYRNIPVNPKQYTGDRWVRKLIINIWSTMLKLWNKRNEIIFDTETNMSRETILEQLTLRLHRCYTLKDRLKASERSLWLGTTMEEKSNEDIKHIQAWLQNVERLIRITKRERRQCPKNSSIMEHFLGIKSQLRLQSH
jgi:hypothetical protein